MRTLASSEKPPPCSQLAIVSASSGSSTSKLESVLAEVNNTPWDERHSYVLAGPETAVWLDTSFDKEFPV